MLDQGKWQGSTGHGLVCPAVSLVHGADGGPVLAAALFPYPLHGSENSIITTTITASEISSSGARKHPTYRQVMKHIDVVAMKCERFDEVGFVGLVSLATHQSKQDGSSVRVAPHVVGFKDERELGACRHRCDGVTVPKLNSAKVRVHSFHLLEK